MAADVKDAGNKVKLLQEEVAYTQSVADTLEQLQICSGLLDNAKGALVEKDISLAVEKLDQANGGIKQLDQYQNSRFAGILQNVEFKDLLAFGLNIPRILVLFSVTRTPPENISKTSSKYLQIFFFRKRAMIFLPDHFLKL